MEMKEILMDLTTEEYTDGIVLDSMPIKSETGTQDASYGDNSEYGSPSIRSDIEMKEMLMDLTTEEYLTGIVPDSELLKSDENSYGRKI